uniref:PAGE family member 3 n=1 Tax=Pipistrellus kuhlii TaxID=59472 RepID=A0A7J7QVW2_PIPKU|nr:PAGE family member 3 [Pipistrellus kuhlii]
MSRIVTSKDDWSSILVEDEESEQQVGPVVDQPPSDDKAKQEEPPTENQDVRPEEEQADAGAPEPEVQGDDLEDDTPELVNPMTGAECGDNPDVIGQAYVHPETIEMPEAGEGKPRV